MTAYACLHPCSHSNINEGVFPRSHCPSCQCLTLCSCHVHRDILQSNKDMHWLLISAELDWHAGEEEHGGELRPKKNKRSNTANVAASTATDDSASLATRLNKPDDSMPPIPAVTGTIGNKLQASTEPLEGSASASEDNHTVKVAKIWQSEMRNRHYIPNFIYIVTHLVSCMQLSQYCK